MCGGFYCSRNTLIFLNLMYIVSVQIEKIILINNKLRHLLKLYFAGRGKFISWMFCLWQSIHWSANTSISNCMR
jgi:hypothetical protein